MHRLNYNHLYYFYVIAREGSIKGASTKLHLTQPTLSDQLRSLEEFFGRQLFERRNRQLFLTNVGQTVLEYSTRIFSLGNELSRLMVSDGETLEKSICIGIEPSLSRTFTYKLLVPIFESKDIKIAIQETELQHLYFGLESGDIDMILTDSHELSKGFSAIDIGASKYYAVCGKKHKKMANSFPQCLQKIPYFQFTKKTKIRHEIDHYFLTKEIFPNVIGEADNLDFLRTVTEKNQCFTVLPENFVREAVKKNSLFVLGEIQKLKTKVQALYNDKTKNRATLEIVEILKSRKKRKNVLPPSISDSSG